MSFELTMAGTRNVKVATELLSDYGNDIVKLKAAESCLFWATTALVPAGATGLPNAGVTIDAGVTKKR